MGASVHPASTGTAAANTIITDTAQNCDDRVLIRCRSPRNDRRHERAGRTGGFARTPRVPRVPARSRAGGRTPVRGLLTRAALAAVRLPPLCLTGPSWEALPSRE